MNLPATILPILLALILPSCESQEGSSKVRGKHESSVMVSIHPTPTFPETNNFLANQMVILTSEVMIDAAAEISRIHSGTIGRALEVRQVEGTDFVKISAHHDEEPVPRTIVMAILKAYSDHREQRVADRANTGLKALEEEIGSQNKRVIETREALTRHIGNYGIPYFDGKAPAPKQGEEELNSLAREKLAEYESQRDQLTVDLKRFNQLAGVDLVRYAASLDYSENQVAHSYQAHLRALADLEKLMESGLGDSHPGVNQLRAKADSELENCRGELMAFKEVLKIKIEMLNRKVGKLIVMIEAMENGGDRFGPSANLNEYNAAKDEYELSRDSLKVLKIRQQEARVLLNTPPEVLTVLEWTHQ